MFRYSNGTVIPNAQILVSGHKHVIRSTKFGDYFRLLLPGTYDVTCRAAGKEITVQVTIKDKPVILDFIVSGDTITGQTVHPKADTKKPSVKEDSVDTPEQRSMDSNTIEKDPVMSYGQKATNKRGLSDNAIAAIVIITIGFIVCAVAGVVLFRRLKELREVEKGYSRIGENGDSESFK